MDSSQQMNKVNGTEEFREFIYRKRFTENEKDILLPLFTLKLETQADNFSCRIKALVDMRRVLSEKSDDFFRDQVSKNWDNLAPILLEELSPVLHKSTQNQKVLSKESEAQEKLEFFKVTGDEVTKTKRPKYLFHKTESYLADVQRDMEKNPKAFLDAMLHQSMPFGKYDKQIKGCMGPSSSPKVAGVVKSAIEVLHGNVDDGRL